MARKKAKSRKTVLRELAVDSGWHMMTCDGLGQCNCSAEILAFLKREGLAEVGRKSARAVPVLR